MLVYFKWDAFNRRIDLYITNETVLPKLCGRFVYVLVFNSNLHSKRVPSEKENYPHCQLLLNRNLQETPRVVPPDVHTNSSEQFVCSSLDVPQVRYGNFMISKKATNFLEISKTIFEPFDKVSKLLRKFR